MENTISIIIPVYNGEEYIADCLNSILNQTYKNLEIIVINDGSTDNSRKILYDYKSKDNRIRIVEQENCGVSSARNRGIKLAISNWIMFVDIDDVLEKDAIENFSNNLSFDYDVIISKIFINTGNRKVKGNCKYNQNMFFDESNKKELIDSIFYDNGKEAVSYIACPFAKVYKKSFLMENGFWFKNGLKYGEDALFNFKVLLFAKKISYINEYTYEYRINSTSAMQKYDDHLIENYTNLLIELKNELNEMKIFDSYKNEYSYYVLRQINRFLKEYFFAKENKDKYMQMKKEFNLLVNHELYNDVIFGDDIEGLSKKRSIAFILIKFKCFKLLKIFYGLLK